MRYWIALVVGIGLVPACMADEEASSPETSAAGDVEAPTASTASSTQRPPEDTPPEKSPVPLAPTLVTKSTAELGLPVATATLVDALAKFTRIESSHVGAGGSPSKAYKAYEALVALVTPKEAVQLLAHHSPVVRGYLAGHVLQAQPADAAAVYPLLADATSVGTLQGCMGGDTRIGEAVTEVLRDALHRAKLGSPGYDALTALALRGARDGSVLPSARANLLQNAARANAQPAKAEARRWLGEPNPELIAGGLTALFLIGADDVLSDVTPLVGHPDTRVRRTAATVLGHIDDPRAAALLSTLAADVVEAVRKSAEIAQLRHPSRPRADVLAALGGPNGHAVSLGLAQLATPWAVDLLIAGGFPTALSSLRRTQDKSVRALVQKAASDPGTDGAAKMRRTHATNWLERTPAP